MTISATPDPGSIGKTTAWNGRVLVPLWTLQIASILTIVIGYIWFCVNLGQTDFWYGSNIDFPKKSMKSFAFISAIILIVLWIPALAMVIFEIVRFHKNNLPAKTMLKSQIILGTFTAICFLIEVLGLAGVIPGGYKSLMDFFGTVLATAWFTGTLIYTSIIFHRRKLAKRDSMNSYGLTNYDEETGKDSTRIGVTD